MHQVARHETVPGVVVRRRRQQPQVDSCLLQQLSDRDQEIQSDYEFMGEKPPVTMEPLSATGALSPRTSTLETV